MQNTPKSLFYNAYLSDNMPAWKSVMDSLDKQYIQEKNKRQLLILLDAQYGYIGYLIGENKLTEADKLLEKARTYTDQFLQSNPANARALAISGAFYGFKVRLSSMTTMYYGPKSIAHIDKALQTDSLSPYAWREKANATYYMPVVFGGSKTLAIEYYQKAIKLFETQNDTVDNWVYLDTRVLLALAYEATNQLTKAQDVYMDILDKTPEFVLVKNKLYPKLKNRMK